MTPINNIIVFILLLIAFACKKNQLGGKAEVKGYIKHHGKNIPYARVFIKFNAKDFPGNDTTVYDAKISADANAYYSIKFYKGDYYLYAIGYDYSIPPPYVVSGGTHVYLRYNEVKQLDIYVTEGD
ncbi:MAG: hypothetical protein KatS3mg027_0328 [Bacteroidia bacterium]|nr:MAG: hypothetical protein KatS3mg027_0328 [Bacteroidia bacterium]